MADAVDVLFVDEAGQISLANVVAMARATDSLVLLGDPQQLDQPLRGTHPPGADRSALAHVLGESATMPPDRGLFLETTWRLHPEPVRVHVRGLLRRSPRPRAAPGRPGPCASHASPSLDGVGPRLRRQPTIGADSEIARVRPMPWPSSFARSSTAARAGPTSTGSRRPLTGRTSSSSRPTTPRSGAIRRRLPPEARVGTVDKFQGQEAPVSIYSLTTSTPELAPRGHGLPVQPQPAQRGDVAGAWRWRSSWPRPTSCGSAPGRRSRCAWPTPSAAGRRSRRAADAGGRRGRRRV